VVLIDSLLHLQSLVTTEGVALLRQYVELALGLGDSSKHFQQDPL